MPYLYLCQRLGWGAELNVRYILKKPLPVETGMGIHLSAANRKSLIAGI